MRDRGCFSGAPSNTRRNIDAARSADEACGGVGRGYDLVS
jgi:hypothetical protein